MECKQLYIFDVFSLLFIQKSRMTNVKIYFIYFANRKFHILISQYASSQAGIVLNLAIDRLQINPKNKSIIC